RYFYLVNSVVCRHRLYHPPQRHQHVRHLAGHDMAFGHVCNIAAVAFTETHQHAAFTRHPPDGKSGAIAVAVSRTVHGRQHRGGLKLADMTEGVFEGTLLDGTLRLGIKVLHGAAAAHAEMRTDGRHSLR